MRLMFVHQPHLSIHKEVNVHYIKVTTTSKFIRRVYGSKEFINNVERYCLWLRDISPNELKSMPKVLERVKNVAEYRLKSNAKSTRDYANYPTLFKQDAQPDTNYLLVPRVSSENRKYIPIGFMSAETICTDAVQMVPNATLYELGILTSNIHMSWMRAVAGRLGMSYRYSNTLVYNTFPWIEGTDEEKQKIMETAQEILDARAKYPESTLADLYDELTMPVELRKVHQRNDAAVMRLYGLKIGPTTESDAVAHLLNLYKQKAK